MKTFTKCSEVVEFLVAQGKPVARARVAVQEAFNYGTAIGGGNSDILLNNLTAHNYNWDNDELAPVAVTEEQALGSYNDMCGPSGYFTETPAGFVFEGGELMYDVEGWHLQFNNKS